MVDDFIAVVWYTVVTRDRDMFCTIIEVLTYVLCKEHLEYYISVYCSNGATST